MTYWDTSRYLSLFIEEATEHLNAIGRDLLHIELQELPIDALFRHVHSVKGMASSMGFERVTALAHCLEDLLGAVRSTPSSVDVNLLLKAVDALQEQIDAIATGIEAPDIASIAFALCTAAFAARKSYASTRIALPPPASSTKAPSINVSLLPHFSVTLRVSTACRQPGVQGMLAVCRMSALGVIGNLNPPLKDIQNGRLPQGLITLQFATNETETSIRQLVNTVPEVELENFYNIVPQTFCALLPLDPSTPIAQKQHIERKETPSTVRVRTEFLDDLLDLSDELLLAVARIREESQQSPSVSDESIGRLKKMALLLSRKVLEARMTPLTVITNQLPRVAHDIALQKGCGVEVIVKGLDVELDRKIVEQFNNMVLHMLRNAVVHGIEPPEERRRLGKPLRGIVKVEVRRVYNCIVLEISDDGRGLDVERIRRTAIEKGVRAASHMSEQQVLQLSTLPGLSTASTVTDLSGRGIGMDTVRAAIESLGGALEIESTSGHGAKFTLSLPVTKVRMQLQLVGLGDEIYGLPVHQVHGVINEDKAIRRHAPELQWNDSTVQIYDLSKLLAVAKTQTFPDVRHYIVVKANNCHIALLVDCLLGQEAILLKSLAKPLDSQPGLAGVAQLSDDQTVFVLDADCFELPNRRKENVTQNHMWTGDSEKVENDSNA